MEIIQYGADHYHWRSQEGSTIINQLYHKYGLEGVNMSYTMQDYIKDLTKENLNLLDPKERLERLNAKEHLEGLDPKELLEELDPKERLEGLGPRERLEGLDPKDLIEKLKQDGISLEEIKKLLKTKS